ncbi:MAG TPA: ABC transporter ATP-binding protein [Solirubrobacteraceae bacterium]
MSLLDVEDLRVTFPTEDGLVRAVDGISYSVDTGKTLGIVGESGSGKSVSSLTTLGLTRSQGARVEGRMVFEGDDLIEMNDDRLRKIRGNDIAMIFQDPLSSLHPFFKVGKQLSEAVLVHRKVSRSAARARAVELLDLVGIPDPERRVDAFPHEFSGGMRQRAMIAMALANEPKLLIADEPTTALDVTVQAQILALLEDLQKRLGMAIIMITHDLGVVAEIADEIAVMYAGRIVEHASTELIFGQPQHPYTWGLLKSIPRLDTPQDEELEPITGRPPSLINRPSGCHFHPRCPYVREAHKRVDPRLDSVAGERDHQVACLLPSELRMRIWRGLQEGRLPAELRALVAERNGQAAAVGEQREPLLSESEPGADGAAGIELTPPSAEPTPGPGQ